MISVSFRCHALSRVDVRRLVVASSIPVAWPVRIRLARNNGRRAAPTLVENTPCSACESSRCSCSCPAVFYGIEQNQQAGAFLDDLATGITELSQAREQGQALGKARRNHLMQKYLKLFPGDVGIVRLERPKVQFRSDKQLPNKWGSTSVFLLGWRWFCMYQNQREPPPGESRETQVHNAIASDRLRVKRCIDVSPLSYDGSRHTEDHQPDVTSPLCVADGPRACSATPGTVSADKCIPSRDRKPDTYLAFWGKIRGILVVRRGKEDTRQSTCVVPLPTRNGHDRYGSGGRVGLYRCAAQALR